MLFCIWAHEGEGRRRHAAFDCLAGEVVICCMLQRMQASWSELCHPKNAEPYSQQLAEKLLSKAIQGCATMIADNRWGAGTRLKAHPGKQPRASEAGILSFRLVPAPLWDDEMPRVCMDHVSVAANMVVSGSAGHSPVCLCGTASVQVGCSKRRVGARLIFCS